MITGKTRTLALIFSLLLCVFAFAGCKMSDDKAALELLQAMKDQAAQQSAQPQAEKYLVIVPASSTSELSLLARDLASEIEKKTGVECGYEYDNVDVEAEKGRLDILLGNTNRRISAEALNKFKNDDYICKLVGGALVIGGVSDSATVVAVERFISEILPSATSLALMPESGGFEYHGEYMLKDMLLCGFDIRDYTIVFSDIETQSVATSLRALIAEQSGIYIALRAGNATSSGLKEILLDIDDTATSARACRVGEDIHLIGKDTYSLTVAVSSFYNMLLASETDGSVSLDISDKLEFSYLSQNISVMSTVSDVPYKQSSVTDIASLANSINYSSSEVVLLGAIDKDVWGAVDPGVEDIYERLELKLSNGTLIPVLYLKESVSVSRNDSVLVDGNEVAVLTVTKNVSFEKYVIYCFASDSVSFESVNQTLKNADGSAMAMVTALESENISVVPDDGVSIVYNGVHSVLDENYRHVWLINYPQLACSDVQSKTLNSSYYVSFEVGSRYCAEYRQLFS